SSASSALYGIIRSFVDRFWLKQPGPFPELSKRRSNYLLEFFYVDQISADTSSAATVGAFGIFTPAKMASAQRCCEYVIARAQSFKLVEHPASQILELLISPSQLRGVQLVNLILILAGRAILGFAFRVLRRRSEALLKLTNEGSESRITFRDLH